MAKWHGKVGFSVYKETTPGVWMDEITEREYSGELIKNRVRTSSNGQVNDSIAISNEIKIIADNFAHMNFRHIKYVEFMGTLHKVSTADVQRPRLILTVGEIYNGN